MTRGPLERLLEPSIDEARIASVWHRIRQTRERGHRVLPRWSFAIPLAAAAVIAIVLAWPSQHGGPLAVRDGSVALAPGAELGANSLRRLSLDDGSTVQVAAASRVQVLANDAEQFSLLLSNGHVDFDVRPGGPRHWQIETSRATVEVVGTQFIVDSDAHHLVVEVSRGVVVVRGERVPGRVVRLTAGQHVEIADADAKADAKASPNAGEQTSAVQVASAAPDVVAPPQVTEPVVEPKVEPSEPSREGPSHGPAPAAKHAGNHSAATPSKTSTPSTAGAAQRDPITAALADADQRRTNGDAAGAAAALEQALAGAHADESAGLAEFTLGRIYLENLHEPTRAVAAFDHVLAIGMPLGLLEDARARRIEALVKAGRTDDAKVALVDYDRQYPHGLHRAMLHALVSP
jgi:transmembrane sensor